MARRPLFIVGAGGFGRETLEAVRALSSGGSRPERRGFDVLGFLDDDARLHGTVVDGCTVRGPSSMLAEHRSAAGVVTVGNPARFDVRPAIVERLALDDSRWATIVHPRASLASRCEVGPGTVVLAGTVATSGVRIGHHVAIMPAVVLTHDDLIEDHATLGSGCRLAGGVTIGRGAYIGAGALVREHVRIGAGALVGMGAGVTRDVPGGEVWAGLPARYLRPVARPTTGVPLAVPDPAGRSTGGSSSTTGHTLPHAPSTPPIQELIQ